MLAEPLRTFEADDVGGRASYDGVATDYDEVFADIRVRRDEVRWLEERLDRIGGRPRVLDWDPMMVELRRVMRPRGRLLILDMVDKPIEAGMPCPAWRSTSCAALAAWGQLLARVFQLDVLTCPWPRGGGKLRATAAVLQSRVSVRRGWKSTPPLGPCLGFGKRKTACRGPSFGESPVFPRRRGT